MRGPKSISIAHKKPDAEVLKKRQAKANPNEKKEKSSKKNSGAPKRPIGAFFIFMEEFRKTYKEKFPDNKSAPVVGKAGGEKWKSMAASEKAPYLAKAANGKTDYEKAMEAFNKKLTDCGEEEKADESEMSTSEVHGEVEEEVSG